MRLHARSILYDFFFKNGIRRVLCLILTSPFHFVLPFFLQCTFHFNVICPLFPWDVVDEFEERCPMPQAVRLTLW